MALDADAAAVLHALAEMPAEAFDETTDALAVRAASEARRRQIEPTPLARVETLTLPLTPSAVRARLYVSALDPGVPPPVLMFFHGGGWVVCSIDSHDDICRRLARASGWAVLSIDYRRAPEATFPGPLEDCYAATCWAAENAGRLGLDASRLAVAGDSSGGNLAAGVALLARDRGGPALLHQMLVYPPLDPAGDTQSYAECAHGCLLTADAMRWYWRQYLGDPAHAASPLAAPALAPSLAGLPSATIVTAEYDPLRDEGEAFGDRCVRELPGSVLRRYDGVMHGFLGMSGTVAKADPCMAFLGARLQAVERASRIAAGGDAS
jgi:acetyl esterase